MADERGTSPMRNSDSYLMSSKMPFTDKDGRLTKAFQKEKT